MPRDLVQRPDGLLQADLVQRPDGLWVDPDPPRQCPGCGRDYRAGNSPEHQ